MKDLFITPKSFVKSHGTTDDCISFAKFREERTRDDSRSYELTSLKECTVNRLNKTATNGSLLHDKVGFN